MTGRSSICQVKKSVNPVQKYQCNITQRSIEKYKKTASEKWFRGS
jgi:hypothetical protein